MTSSPSGVHHVMIIGAGVAGLSCAYRLQEAGISSVVLERESTFGGRTKMADIAGKKVPLGAGIVYAATPTDDLCIEFDIERQTVVPRTFSVNYRGVTVVASTDGELAAGLPISAEAKVELVRVLRRMRSEYGALSEHGLTLESDELLDQSFRDYLGNVHPEVAEFFEGVVFAFSMARADEMSAKYALRYLSAKIMRDGTHSYYIPDGMGKLATEFHKRLHQEIRYETTVEEVRETARGSYEIRVNGPTGAQTLETQHVVFAVPGPEVSRLAPRLPESKKEAIKTVGSVASITMAVVTEKLAEAAWENVFMTGVVGGAFDYIVDPCVGTSFNDDGKSTFQIGLWRERAEATMQWPDSEIEEQWLNQLEALFPGIGDAVLGVQVQRWPSCFAVPLASRGAVLEQVTSPIDGLHFAGDYASESAGTHGAIESGARVSQEIVSALAR